MFNDFNSSIMNNHEQINYKRSRSDHVRHILHLDNFVTNNVLAESKIRCVRLIIMKIKMQNHHKEKKCVGQLKNQQQMLTSFQMSSMKKKTGKVRKHE